MTPENDVNKESEQDDLDSTDSADNPSADKDANPDEKAGAGDGAGSNDNGAVAEPAVEAVKEGSVISDDEVVSDGQEDDIDRAASAQIADGDDPLGFGNTRMEGESPDGDDASPLQSQLEQAEAKVSSQADQLLRMQAEMENQRKRAQNDVTKAHKFALEKIALDLLPVRDSLEMGLQAATGEDANPEKIIEGSELTLKMLTQALEKYNIVEVNPIDEKFDPEFHQAMSMQPVEGKEPNTVAGVMQKGYTLNDRLIRPALVMVAK